jgi:hypothetical protein
VATLTVGDNAGGEAMQTVLVEAVEPNIPPVAVAAADVTSGPAPLDVVFSAAGSYDPDGFVGNIHWVFGDGGEYWGGTAYHTFDQEGTWDVTVTAHDRRGGTGTASLTVVVGQPAPPAAPSNLVAVAFTSEWINVTWSDNSNNETGFSVERCRGTASFCGANPSQFTEIAQTGANVDYYGDTGLPAATTFSYRVRAFNASGPSAYSNIASATTLGGPPAAPTALTALAGIPRPTRPRGAFVDLSWADNSADETSFVVERCRGVGCTDFAVRATVGANATTYRDGSLPRRVTYRYRVKARNASGDSAYSNIATATTP